MSEKVRKMRTPLIWFAAALIYVLPFFALQGFGGAFLKIGDIEGESTQENHEKKIEVLSWNWGVTQPETSHTVGGSRTTGDISVRDFSFTHEFDRASPALALNCFNGKRLPEAVFTMTKTVDGDKIVDYLIVTLTDVLVSSITQTASDANTPPVEKVTLNYSKIKFEYTPSVDGKTGSTVDFYWDVKENKEG